jgi:hypothetical protein
MAQAVTSLGRLAGFIAFDLSDFGGRVAHLHANLLRGPHCIEDAADDLSRARSTRFVSGLFLQQLGMRQDDAQLIIQLVKKLPKFTRLIHSAPLEQICN